MADASFQEIGLTPAEAGPAGRARRGARLPRFLGVKLDPGSVLDALRVVLVGLGSVGRNIAIHLARLQIAALWLIDHGRFKPESLLTQPITPAEIGQPKASSAGRLCKQISPHTRVLVLDGPVQALDLMAFSDADLVMLATDNLRAEVEVGQRCLYLGKPLIQASVDGDTLLAQVRFFGNAGGTGPCPACLYGAAERDHLNRETTFSCQGADTGQPLAATVAPPTMSVSFLCDLAANLALVQCCRHQLRLGAPVADSLLEYCGYTHRVVTAALRRNEHCPCEHLAWIEAPLPTPLASCSLRELTAAAGLASVGALEGIAFTVADWLYAEQGACAACGHGQRLDQFLLPGQQPVVRCGVCGGPLHSLPFHAHRPVPAAVALPVLDRPLSQLTATPPRWVVVRGGDRAVLFRQASKGEEIVS